ncbi:hypothetical protein ACMAUO_05735 [Gluconacetobacter sp. Hr-1-5]|uniref:hypothetical protein n=1 Tax=Gluconacetobacter sp. Hr-1-5 TaxID=3395370 RepID=UPI003B519DB6
MITAIAPYVLIVWFYGGHGPIAEELPMKTQEVCESEGKRLTTGRGFGQNWSGYQCVATGYGEKP